MLGLPIKDYDLTTGATPSEVTACFFPGATKFVGANFGVSLVRVDGFDIEVATFRTDGAYSDNRHPDNVAFTKDVREDVARRDFTVNALLMNEHAELVDHVDGLVDLNRRVLRTVGDPVRRFTEDALRMLRLVRFAVQLDFDVHEDTAAAVTQLAETVRKVSSERVNVELSKMLLSDQADRALRLMDELGLLVHVLPEVSAMRGVDQNPAHHPEGDVFLHTQGLLSHMRPGHSLTLALSALLHDVAKPTTAVRNPETGQNTFHGHETVGAEMADAMLRRLKFPNEVTEVVVSHVAQHMRFMAVEQMRPATLSRFVRQENFAELLELHRLDCMGSDGDLKHHEFVEQFMRTVPETSLRPVRLLTGEDLKELGLKPGPQFRTLLEAVETAQLEGRVSTRDQAVALVREAAGL